MRRAAVAGMLAIAAAAGAAAETIRVRTGEHPGFTRIVIETAPGTAWRLGRDARGYALDLALPDGPELDLSGAFDRIPRTRVAALAFDAAARRLAIPLACRDCHARAFPHPRGWVVIDLADGPPPAGSPFEAPLPPSAAGAAAAARPPVPPGIDQAPDAPDAEAAAAAAAGSAASLPSWIDALLAPPRAGASPPTADPTPGRWPPAAGPGGSPAIDALPRSQPAADFAAAEARLARELARAAAQGLVDLAVPLPDPPAADSAPAPPPLPPGDPAGSPPQLDAVSAIDRDAGGRRMSGATAADGAPCLPDSTFAIEDWGGDEPPAEGIARRRAALLGEFDEPDREAVIDLVRYYLHLGLGAEAAATLRAFGAGGPEEAVLAAMATAVDGGANGVAPNPEASALLAAQAGCPGRASLWAVLAGAPPLAAGDRRGLVAAFSALPPGLRRHLGPALGARYLEAGDAATAGAILDALARAPGDPPPAGALLAARLDLAEAAADPASAAARMRAAAATAPALAPEAWAAALEAELAAGRLSPAAAETAAALAVEAGPGPLGQRLARLSIRARLAAGEFATARAALAAAARPPPTPLAAVAPRLWAEYFAALAAGADDATFLIEAVAARDRLREGPLPEAVRLALARRFAALGFADEVLQLIPGDAGGEEARLLRAGALLDTGAAAAAVGVLAGIEGEAAERLRGRAFLALGDPRSAADRFRRAGDAAAARRAALAAGDWPQLTGEGAGALAVLAQHLSGGAAPGPDAAEAAPPAARPERSAGPSGPPPDAADDGAAGAPSGPAPVLAARAALQEVRAIRAALAEALAKGPEVSPP
jgi:hypothetical protein